MSVSILGRRTRARLAAASIAIAASAFGVAPASAAIIAGDSFSVTMIGHSSGNTHSLFQLTANFGQDQLFAGAGYNGQDIRVKSRLVAGLPGKVNAIFEVTTPVSFLQQNTINGSIVAGLTLSLSGIDFDAAPTGFTQYGDVNYGSDSYTYNPATSFTNGAMTTSGSWSSGSWGVPVSPANPNRFLYVASFDGVLAAVPEPASWAMMLAGFGLVGVAMRRRSGGLATA